MGVINKFSLNGGELSPWLTPRIDLEKYHSGAQLMENMNVVRYGGASGRAGFMYLNATKTSSSTFRLEGFNFSRTDSVVVEFGNLYARFYKNGARLGAPYEIVTPYLASQVHGLKFSQRNDVIIITHPSHHPQILSHIGDTSWTIADVSWKNRPWQDLNSTTTTLSVSALTGTGVTMTASASHFDATHVGSRYRLIHNSSEETYNVSLAWATTPSTYITGATVNDNPVAFSGSGTYFTSNASGNTHVIFAASGPDYIYRCIQNYDATTAWSAGTNYAVNGLVANGGNNYVCTQVNGPATTVYQPGVTTGWESYWTDIASNPGNVPAYFSLGLIVATNITVAGSWTFDTKGTWEGEWRIERSYDAGSTWSAIKTVLSVSDANFSVAESEDEDNPALFRLVATRSRFTDDDAVTLRVLSRQVTGEVLVTGYTSATQVTVTVESNVNSTQTTKNWSEDGFNPRLGYPVASTFHEERLYFGGVSGAKSNPQTLWASVVNDYYNFKTGTDNADGLKFTLAANSYDGIVWFKSHKTLIIGTSGGIWSLGSTDDAPVNAGNRRVRLQSALGCESLSPLNLNDSTVYVQREGRKINEVFGDAYTGYSVIDLTELAEHITVGGLTQITSMTQPDTRLLGVRADGQLVVMTYDKKNRIYGWSRWVTTGVIETVATVYGQDEDDEIYVGVRRTINGSTVRYIERLKPDIVRAEEADNHTEFVYQDSAYIYSGTSTTSITGLSHLEGATVQVLADGAYVGDKTVSSGAITLDKAATKVVVGLQYIPLLRTMPLEEGMTLGERKRVNKAYIRMKDSQGCQIGQGDGTWTTVPARDASENMDTPVPTRTYDAVATIPNRSKRQMSLDIRQSNPASFNVIAVMPKIKTGRE